MMTAIDWESFIASLELVEREENYGYSFFFVGDDHRLPFVTIAHQDNEYETVSNLNREGVFRINIGLSKETFESLLGDYDSTPIDYTALDVFMPHPDYAKQHFVCILNPSETHAATTKTLIAEAHAIASKRMERQKAK